MSLFTFEALNADDGDCLVIHHGTAAAPAHILIDGGRRPVLARSLVPRLDELRQARGLAPDEALPIALAVLTHVDADHVDGLEALLDSLVEQKEHRQPLPWTIDGLWLNSFDGVLKNHEAAKIQSLAAAGAPPHVQAFAASVRQGMHLRDHANRLGIPINAEFDSGFVARPDDAVMELPWDELKLTVIAPARTQIEALERVWDRELAAMEQHRSASGSASVINASSIVLLVESAGKKLLLTGDAESDEILAGLQAAGLLGAGRPCVVDVLKLPHHGSCRNCSPALFEQVHASHYVVSANGRDDNPDLATLDRLWQARQEDRRRFTLHTTFAKDAHREIDPRQAADAKRGDALRAIQDWLDRHPIDVQYRSPKALGITIALGDETL